MPDPATLTTNLRNLAVLVGADGWDEAYDTASAAADLIDQLTTDLDTVNEDERVYIERLEAQAKEHKARIAELEAAIREALADLDAKRDGMAEHVAAAYDVLRGALESSDAPKGEAS